MNESRAYIEPTLALPKNVFKVMTEKCQKKKLRKDTPNNKVDMVTASSIVDENCCLSDQYFKDISSEIENRLSKCLRDSEHIQREILIIFKTKVDNLSNDLSEQECSTFELNLTEFGRICLLPTSKYRPQLEMLVPIIVGRDTFINTEVVEARGIIGGGGGLSE